MDWKLRLLCLQNLTIASIPCGVGVHVIHCVPLGTLERLQGGGGGGFHASGRFNHARQAYGEGPDQESLFLFTFISFVWYVPQDRVRQEKMTHFLLGTVVRFLSLHRVLFLPLLITHHIIVNVRQQADEKCKINFDYVTTQMFTGR